MRSPACSDGTVVKRGGVNCDFKCPTPVVTRETFAYLPEWLKKRLWYSLPAKWRWCADWRWWKVAFCSYERKKERAKLCRERMSR
mgnify:CR=1 FL=1